MRSRIQQLKLMRIHADPDLQPCLKFFLCPCQCFGSGFDWIRIQLGLWIRILFHEAKMADTKKKRGRHFKCWMFSFEGCFWGIRINMLLYIFINWIFLLKIWNDLVIKNLNPDPESMNMYILIITGAYFFSVFSIQFVCYGTSLVDIPGFTFSTS